MWQFDQPAPPDRHDGRRKNPLSGWPRLLLLCLAGLIAAVPASSRGADDVPAENPFRFRIPAPSLDGGTDWINTKGPIDIKDLRGKFVLLDFWTYCCINCMHILPELKKLEEKYPGSVVVIGVHSAKFDTEKDSKNIAEAVLRYEIEHPVVNDANHAIWNNYEVQSWPSLRLIDPEGKVVGSHSGEITFEELDAVVSKGVAYYRSKGLLDEKRLRFDLERFSAAPTPLRFPGKVLADEKSSRLFIADSNHNRIVVAGLDGKLQHVIGTGAIGRADGEFDQAEFNHPQGMALDGQTLYVADNENHLLRAVDLDAKRVKTIAGTGKQSRHPWPGIDPDNPGAPLPRRPVGPARTTALSSPWDLLVHEDNLYIAMAGPHQIWRMSLKDGEIGPYAGNGREDIVDGRLLPPTPYGVPGASFAQPSGLATDGKVIFVADSEGSSIRAVPFSTRQEVETIIGTAHLPFGRLFAFGDVDGTGEQVRLQHALGVVFYRDALYVADTYNNKIKQVDLAKRTVLTVSGEGAAGASDDPPRFDEPGGISAAAGKLFVADTNNHAIRTIDLDQGNRVATLAINGLEPPRQRQPSDEGSSAFADALTVNVKRARVQPKSGLIRLAVRLKLPDGYKINPDAPMKYRVMAASEQGPVDRAAIGELVNVEQPSATPRIDVPVTATTGTDSLKVSLVYFYCQQTDRGICKQGAVTWTVPLEISPEAKYEVVTLPLDVP